MQLIELKHGGGLFAGMSCIGFLHKDEFGEVKYYARDGYILSSQVMKEIIAHIEEYKGE